MATGRILKATSIEGAVTQIIEVGCDSAAAVDDLVYVSTTVVSFVDVVTDHVPSRPVIGMILEKVTAVTCKVAVSGVLADPDSTAPGKIYLSAAGRISNTVPAPTGHKQILGYSFGGGLIDFKPEKTLVKLT